MDFLRRALGLSLTVPLIVAACGGNDSSSSPGGVALADLPDQLAGALCDAVDPCFGPLLASFLKGKDCKTSQIESLQQGEFSLLQTAIDDGRVKYDGTRVAACLSAVKAAACDVISTRLSDLCPGVITGTVATGGDCTMNAECTPGDFCDESSTCPGKCAALLGEGSACTDDDECKSGMVCPDSTKVCTNAGKKDDACEGPDHAGACGGGLICAGASDTKAGQCETITSAFAAEDGAPCDPTASVLCAEGLVCAALSVDQAGAITWKCEKAATGSDCHVAFPESCPEGQYCKLTPNTLDGKCTALPGDGDACAAHAETDKTKDLCSNTTTCVAGTCKAIQDDGAACTTDEECLSKVCANEKCSPTRCGEVPAK
ncbi:MAG TPA: Dickkopf N-terminal cysteine-rich domain-containing protein [Polyangiaceae bacterium]|nr:Dickkopf N-terminal cysteine-rich domain-containing protein [Polyangiaceae bacterium]